MCICRQLFTGVTVSCIFCRKLDYYMLESSPQIQRTVLLDDGTSHSHYLNLTAHAVMLQGVLSKLLTFHVLIIHRYRYKCTISVTQLVMQYFRSLETILDLIIGLLCFNAYITSIHSNTCGRFDMIETLIKTLSDLKSPACGVPSSSKAERRICPLDCNMQ